MAVRTPRAAPPLLARCCWLLACACAGALQVIHGDAPGLRCSQGLTECHVSSDCHFSAALPDPDATVHVTNVHLEVILRCSATQDCDPYLQITIAIEDLSNTGEVSEESGEHNDEDELFYMNQMSDGSYGVPLPVPRALVKVCVSSPGTVDCCKTIQFKSSYSGLHRASSLQLTHELLLIQKTTLGSPVVVLVWGHEMDIIRNITIPSLTEVCAMNLKGTEKKCDAPRLRAVTDHKRNVVLLQMENTDDEPKCRMVRKETGEVLAWPEGKREMVLPSHFVVPCLCLQVWCEGKELRREFWPFKNQQDALERMQHNVTVTMVESRTRDGSTVLTWNVAAPCQLEADMRLCQKDLASGQCDEVTGSRQTLNGGGWRATRGGYRKTGEFNVSSHPLLCVQIKLHGMKSFLDPQCSFTISRWRWSLLILIGLILMCLAILGAYLIQGVLKGYMWRWLKEDDVKGAVGGGHVVLLYPPGDDQGLPELMSHLGSSLQALGFSVSLDLWSRTELSALGPVPWLHSRLNRLQRQGGKVVLVLTQAAWIKAEEWGARSWERRSPVPEEEEEEEEQAGRSYAASSPCGDVFTASLSCILADYLQGCAGDRFMLVQLESLPPEPPGGFRPLPELFRGLHVYSLPSQSLGFLTELAGARQMATASARRKRAGGLRMASRALARRLSGFTAGATVIRLAGVSRSCVGMGGEDSGETVPLQPCLNTPPSSPDSSPRLNDMEWV